MFDRTTMALLLMLPLLITTSFADRLPSTTSTKPQSIASCTLPKDCGDKSIATHEFMCLCQKVAMSAAYNGGDTSTNAGNDNSPFPGYLRNNYANDLQNGASMTICHGMVQSKLIVPKCLVGKYSKRRRAAM